MMLLVIGCAGLAFFYCWCVVSVFGLVLSDV